MSSLATNKFNKKSKKKGVDSRAENSSPATAKEVNVVSEREIKLRTKLVNRCFDQVSFRIPFQYISHMFRLIDATILLMLAFFCTSINNCLRIIFNKVSSYRMEPY